MSDLRVATGTPVVIDSSVAFKWYDRTESGANEALGLLEQHRVDTIALVAPVTLPLEVLNGLACRPTPLEILRDVEQELSDADLALAPLESWLLTAALEISLDEHIPLYDALFIALAERLEAPLVTADRRQATTRRCAVRLLD
ncbi:MAG TPA: type II toxin-antitoxin system VapC family toxin [Coriobacteriia bacterium]|nr:type II toxin-antitoxin system VapC family toxin [Coriobacteriia bacterium]